MTLWRFSPWLAALVLGLLLSVWTVARRDQIPVGSIATDLGPFALGLGSALYFTVLARWGLFAYQHYGPPASDPDLEDPVLAGAIRWGGLGVSIIMAAMFSAGPAGPLRLSWAHAEASAYFFVVCLMAILPVSYWGVRRWAQAMSRWFGRTS